MQQEAFEKKCLQATVVVFTTVFITTTKTKFICQQMVVNKNLEKKSFKIFTISIVLSGTEISSGIFQNGYWLIFFSYEKDASIHVC